MESCEKCRQEVWKEGSWKREFDDKYAKLMNSCDVEWIDKANAVLTNALDKIDELVRLRSNTAIGRKRIRQGERKCHH